MRKLTGFFIIFICITVPIDAQIRYTQDDSTVFERFLQYSKQGNNSIIHTARFFMDVPYVGGTLEGDSVEHLRVNLRELDCFTFMETVIALHLMLQSKELSFERFCNNLQYIRYRGGILDGYLSRLHYTSEWLSDNQHKGILDLPELPSCQVFSPNISFMSSHCDLYPALKAHPAWCKAILQTETDINKLQLTYIPKELVNATSQNIRNGDIIAITTRIKGLDIAHVGFALIRDKKVYLLHASSEAKKVIISDETLYDYLMNRKNHSGIIVARMK